MLITLVTSTYTVEPLNNGHFGTSNFWHNFTVVERLSSFRGNIVCHGPVGTTKFVLYREVKCIVSFIGSVL